MKRGLTDAIGNSLFGKSDGIECSDAASCLKRAMELSVGALVYDAFTASGAADGVEKSVIEQLDAQGERNREAIMHTARVARLLEGVPYVVINGAASLRFYNEPLTRETETVEVLVKKDRFNDALKALEDDGFKRTVSFKNAQKQIKADSEQGYADYKKGDIAVRVYMALPWVRAYVFKEMIEQALAGVFDTAVEYVTEYGAVRIPDEAHHGLILLTLMASYAERRGMTLVQLCDWASYASVLNEAEIRSTYGVALDKIGLWHFMQVISQVAVHVGLPYAPWMGETDNELNELVAKDIFGESIVPDEIAEDKKRGIKRYIAIGIASVKQIYPITQKHKILLPLFFAVFYIKTAKRAAHDKNVRDAVFTEFYRYEAYKKLMQNGK